ncbi:hypothetical protein [Saccharopolyspora spinosa]|nr:hypothetical protein [Saccharopolyspora spinosa]
MCVGGHCRVGKLGQFDDGHACGLKQFHADAVVHETANNDARASA